MFNSVEGTSKGQGSRATILLGALDLFRRKGFDAAKMRDIAQEAGVALGAAYYYFPSKDAIILAYYESVHNQHAERVHAALRQQKLTLRDRLGSAFHSKLDILEGDQKLLGAIFRYTGEPNHPLSCLGPATRSSRQKSIALFAQAVGNESLPKDLQQFIPIALWALHMAVLLFFIYDHSPQHKRTRKLVDGALDLTVSLLGIARSPLLKPFRGRLFSVLQEADIFSGQGNGQGIHPAEDFA